MCSPEDYKSLMGHLFHGTTKMCPPAHFQSTYLKTSLHRGPFFCLFVQYMLCLPFFFKKKVFVTNAFNQRQRKVKPRIKALIVPFFCSTFCSPSVCPTFYVETDETFRYRARPPPLSSARQGDFPAALAAKQYNQITSFSRPLLYYFYLFFFVCIFT